MTYKANDWGAVVFLVFVGAILTAVGWIVRANIDALREMVDWIPPDTVSPLEDYMLSVIGSLGLISIGCLVLGIVILVVSAVAVGFVATQRVRMPCPHCGQSIVPRVKGWSGHLYLSKGGEHENE